MNIKQDNFCLKHFFENVDWSRGEASWGLQLWMERFTALEAALVKSFQLQRLYIYKNIGGCLSEEFSTTEVIYL